MSPSRRLFFALWPPETLRQALATVASAECAHGRLVPAQRIHLTLAFLGSVSQATARCLMDGASRLHAEPFALALDRLGCWRRVGILWAAPSVVPEPLLRLVASLADLISGCGLEPESRPFQAHITLARKVRPGGDSRALTPPLPWPVGELHLIQSETLPEGPRYTPIGRWRLN